MQTSPDRQTLLVRFPPETAGGWEKGDLLDAQGQEMLKDFYGLGGNSQNGSLMGSLSDLSNNNNPPDAGGPLLVPGELRSLKFHAVFDEHTPQSDLFEHSGVKDLIQHALDGYATTIFAYGQTGSGKTFTITGPDATITTTNNNNNNNNNNGSVLDTNLISDKEGQGIIPRALEFLYTQIQNLTGSPRTPAFNPHLQHPHHGTNIHVSVRAAYLEIHNEQVLDLLNPPSPPLPVRWTLQRGFYVDQLFVVDCESLEDCLAVLEEGLRNRTKGSHRLNERSSRSHSILTVYLDVRTREGNGSSGGWSVKRGKVSFVDLAGSEKVKESKATGETLTETLNINKSLLTLGNCISSLASPSKRQSHIPYRDSKLTKLLADSLGGSGLALMIACVSPSSFNLHESLKTLRYAQRARKVRQRPVVRVDAVRGDGGGEVGKLRREVRGLREENALLRAATGLGGAGAPQVGGGVQWVGGVAGEFMQQGGVVGGGGQVDWEGVLGGQNPMMMMAAPGSAGINGGVGSMARTDSQLQLYYESMGIAPPSMVQAPPQSYPQQQGFLPQLGLPPNNPHQQRSTPTPPKHPQQQPYYSNPPSASHHRPSSHLSFLGTVPGGGYMYTPTQSARALASTLPPLHPHPHLFPVPPSSAPPGYYHEHMSAVKNVQHPQPPSAPRPSSKTTRRTPTTTSLTNSAASRPPPNPPPHRSSAPPSGGVVPQKAGVQSRRLYRSRVPTASIKRPTPIHTASATTHAMKGHRLPPLPGHLSSAPASLQQAPPTPKMDTQQLVHVGMLRELETIEAVTSVKRQVIQDVEAIEREIGRMSLVA
ncbi:Kinesin- protein 12 [Chytridiales sp. JEL 0842]|nr:Kinesin- protein 12 [Chytridiales sp. JEL 0842]